MTQLSSRIQVLWFLGFALTLSLSLSISLVVKILNAKYLNVFVLLHALSRSPAYVSLEIIRRKDRKGKGVQ